ncbi:hypothetical protein EJB05_44473, partial [Eragrostis curvula]
MPSSPETRWLNPLLNCNGAINSDDGAASIGFDGVPLRHCALSVVANLNIKVSVGCLQKRKLDKLVGPNMHLTKSFRSE